MPGFPYDCTLATIRSMIDQIYDAGNKKLVLLVWQCSRKRQQPQNSCPLQCQF